jgi:hypothetical protein
MWLRQRDGVTCGPSVAVMAGALLDPRQRARLQGEGAQQWFAAEQGRVHRSVNVMWPRALGTTPAGMARALSGYGTRYQWRPAARALTQACAAVGDGWPVAMLIGAAIPRHWVLLTELSGSSLRCYEPSSGRSVEIAVDDIPAARLESLGFPKPFVFVLPNR